MKIHPREAIVDEAERELIQWSLKHKLTMGEETMLYGQRLSHFAKYQIRYERHGRRDKEGGLE